MDFTFGGVKFSCKDASPSFSRILVDILPLDYISFLVTYTYSAPCLKQPVLDALSPFQLVSKAWAVSALKYVPSFKSVYYPGSWFGQLAVSVHHTYKSDHARHGNTVEHTLVDLDLRSCDVAKAVIAPYMPRQHIVLVGDALTLRPPTEPSLFLWTGLEHFNLEKVKQFVRRSLPGTTFLFQGTDMPAPDHISPISSPDVILAALDVDPESVSYKGSILSHIGNRHQVVFTV